MRTERVLLITIFLLIASAACVMPYSSQHNIDFIAGAVAMTMQARSAEKTASALIAPPIVSGTLPPAATLPPEPEDNPDPCYQALLIGESVPDGTILEDGEAFAKSWILRNTGSCTWTPDYRLVFSSGDQMGGPDSVRLDEYVAPGDHTEILVQLTAPSQEGTHTGYWRMKANNGVRFARIFVEIEVESSPTPTRTTVPPVQCTFGAAYNYWEFETCEWCGDGAVQASEGENCDDGGNTSGDGCDATCQSEICLFGAAYNYGLTLPCEWCGDGAVQAGAGETCDDGNNTSLDGCSETCQAES